jgi:MFS family permease
MHFFNHYNNNKIYRAIHSDFWLYEFSIWLHTVAYSLIAIFVPIILLQLGYSVVEVLLYYVIFHIIDIPGNFLARRLVSSWGARVVIILATFSIILYFFVFYYLTANAWAILLVLALLAAIYDSFYWVAHMYLFAESSGDLKQAGKKTGIMYGVRAFAGMFGPAIGALIMFLGNKNILIIVSIIIFTFSILPLLKLQHIRNKPKPKKISFKEFFSDLRERRDYLSLLLYSVNASTESLLWPIFIFIFFGTLSSIGWLIAVTSLSTIIFSYFAGIVTKENQSKLITIGSVAIAVIWIFRLVFPGPITYYASVFFMGFFAILVSIPLEGNIVERSKVRDSLLAATFRNASTMLPQIFIYAFLVIIVGVFKVGFIIAISSLFALVLVNRIFSEVVGEKTRVNVKK